MMSTTIVTTTQKSANGREHTVQTIDRHIDAHLAVYTVFGVLVTFCFVAVLDMIFKSKSK